MSRKRPLSPDVKQTLFQIRCMMETDECLYQINSNKTMEENLTYLITRNSSCIYLHQSIADLTLLEQLFEIISSCYQLDAKKRNTMDLKVDKLMEKFIIPNIPFFLPNTKLCHGHNVLTYLAVKFKWDEKSQLQLMFDKFVEIGCDVNHLTNYGESALQLAIFFSEKLNTATLISLAKAGADTLIKNIDNNTILHLLARKEHIIGLKEIFESNLLGLESQLFLHNNSGQTPLQLAKHTSTIRTIISMQNVYKNVFVPFYQDMLSNQFPNALCGLIVSFI